jgi:hypothetical protein
MKSVFSNDPAPIGERCFLCEEPLTPPWVKTEKYRMHTACRDLVREDFEATHRRRLINPKRQTTTLLPWCGRVTNDHAQACPTTAPETPAPCRQAISRALAPPLGARSRHRPQP